MCFSPLASFATAGVTGVVGLLALSRVREPRDLLLAAVPIFFGAQQAIEGGLWLLLPVGAHAATAILLTLLFLLFAKVFWPVYAPLMAALSEPSGPRRRLMFLCLVVGVGLAVYHLSRLLTGPREAEIVHNCIVYRTGEANPMTAASVYFMATVLPLTLSSRRTIVVLGAVMGVGCVVAYLFYLQAFLSVWCFFAAAGSAVILAHFKLVHRRLHPAAA
jgi:hypothetical protein